MGALAPIHPRARAPQEEIVRQVEKTKIIELQPGKRSLDACATSRAKTIIIKTNGFLSSKIALHNSPRRIIPWHTSGVEALYF